ncbi:MAG: hypothetical protein GC145_07460 [Caulobacter sp.]|nr:hypothetical protein [Caulobacter sp.]
MKRTSACLAALVIGLVATQSLAQPSRHGRTPKGADPIGDLIDRSLLTGAQAPGFGEMAPIPDDSVQTQAVDDNADWTMKVTLYHSGGGGAGTRDSLGCPVVAMRTAAVDPAVAPRRSILFIPATVGLKMPDGSSHDGYWYASDTGGAIKGAIVDLFTGHGRRSMQPLMKINTRNVAVMKAGTFTGCPKAGSRVASK